MLLVIANPKAGKKSSSLRDVKNCLSELAIDHDIRTCVTPPEAAALIDTLSLKSYSAVAIFAGDGTVAAVLKMLQNTKIPVLILPGGSANLFAKDFNLPLDIYECMKLYKNGTLQTMNLSVATAGPHELLLDMHFGFWTETIGTTPHGLKRHIGQLAYALNALKRVRSLQKYDFAIEVDGQKRKVSAYALFIANHGKQQFFGKPMFQKDKTHKLGLAIVGSLSPFSVMKWLYANKGPFITTQLVDKITVYEAPHEMIIDDAEKESELPLQVMLSDKTVSVFTLQN